MATELTKRSVKFVDIVFQLALVLTIILGAWWLVYLVARDVWNAAWNAVSTGRISPEFVALTATSCLIVAIYLIGLLQYRVRRLENRVEWLSEWLGKRMTKLEERQH